MSYEAQMAALSRTGQTTEPRERGRNFPERAGCEKSFLRIDNARNVG